MHSATFQKPFVSLLVMMNQGAPGYLCLFKGHCEMFYYILS